MAETQYKVDGATSWSSGDAVVLSADGIHTIRYRSADNAGNVEETQYTSVKIDATAPDVSLLGVDDAWHAGPVMALIAASDATSGVQATSYDLDGAGWVPGVGLLVTTEGDHTLDYTATDNAGNAAATQHAHIKMDLTPPTSTDDAPTVWTSRAVTIHLSASDALSGMGAPAATMYSKDGGATWRAGTTFTITAHPKFHSTDGLEVLYRSTDAVGNTEAVKACTVPIDTRPPTTAASLVRCTKGGRAVFKFRVLDPTPGSPTTSATQPVRMKTRCLRQSGQDAHGDGAVPNQPPCHARVGEVHAGQGQVHVRRLRLRPGRQRPDQGQERALPGRVDRREQPAAALDDLGLSEFTICEAS